MDALDDAAAAFYRSDVDVPLLDDPSQLDSPMTTVAQLLASIRCLIRTECTRSDASEFLHFERLHDHLCRVTSLASFRLGRNRREIDQGVLTPFPDPRLIPLPKDPAVNKSLTKGMLTVVVPVLEYENRFNWGVRRLAMGGCVNTYTQIPRHQS